MTSSNAPFEPVVIDATGPSIEDERFTVFEIIEPGDAPVRQYTAPRRISAGAALRAIHIAASRGDAAAEAWCARYALGDQGVNALYGCKHIIAEQANEIMGNLGKLFFGQAREQAAGANDEGESAPGN